MNLITTHFPTFVKVGKWLLKVGSVLFVLYAVFYGFNYYHDYQQVEKLKPILTELKTYYEEHGHFPNDKEFAKLFPNAKDNINGFDYYDSTAGDTPSEFSIKYSIRNPDRRLALGDPQHGIFYEGYYSVSSCDMLIVCDSYDIHQRDLAKQYGVFREQPWTP